MSLNNVSAVLSKNELDEIKALIGQIKAKMPFLINITVEEKSGLFKLGPKSLDFVTDAAMAATNYPNVLPPSFEAAEFQKDANLFAALTEIKQLLDSLVESVSDTQTMVGSEAMAESLDVYAYVQTAAGSSQQNEGLKTVASKLKDRFRQRNTKKKVAA